MKQGYNKELAINASSKRLGLDKVPISKFDSNGNVIRDFRSELNTYVKQEEIYVLPSVEGKYFDSHREFKNNVIAKNKDFTFEVRTVRLAPMIKNRKRFSVLNLFVVSVNFFFSKFKKPSKEELIPQKGYYWIYNQIQTADSSCKRKIAS